MKQFRIFLSPPFLTGKEQELVADAFESNWIAPLGPHVDAFEQELADYLGVRSVAAVSSGTAAIHLALLTLKVAPGDTVLCSSFTFAGSANPILYCGARPVFIDSEPGTWNICPRELERALSKLRAEGVSPRALILVEIYGLPARTREILEICAHFKVPVVEDSAEALGTNVKGKKLGSFGEVSILSFNGNKIITTSGGGALASQDEKMIARARFLATQARDPAPHYQHSTIGYNYRLSNVLAALGRAQLSTIDLRLTRRREIFSWYRELLAPRSEIEFPPETPDAFPNRWLTTVLLPSATIRDTVMAKLAEAGIEARPLWKPMHLQPVFLSAPSFVNGCSEELFSRGVCLPSGTGMTRSQVEEVCALTLSTLEN